MSQDPNQDPEQPPHGVLDKEISPFQMKASGNRKNRVRQVILHPKSANSSSSSLLHTVNSSQRISGASNLESPSALSNTTNTSGRTSTSQYVLNRQGSPPISQPSSGSTPVIATDAGFVVIEHTPLRMTSEPQSSSVEMLPPLNPSPPQQPQPSVMAPCRDCANAAHHQFKPQPPSTSRTDPLPSLQQQQQQQQQNDSGACLALLHTMETKLEAMHGDIKELQRTSSARSVGHGTAATAAGGSNHFSNSSAMHSARTNPVTESLINTTAQSILSNGMMVESPSNSSTSSSSSEDSPAPVEKKTPNFAVHAKKPTPFSQAPPGHFGAANRSPNGGRKRQPIKMQGEVLPSNESAVVIGVGRAQKRTSLDCDMGSMADHARAQDTLDKVSRRRSIAARTHREHFFSPLPLLTEIADPARLGDRQYMESIMLTSAPCSWLCCISMALSYVSRVPTPIERILRKNHLAIHYIALSSVTLAEVYDMVQDFIQNSFHSDSVGNFSHLSPKQISDLQHVHVEMATFDKELVDVTPEEEDAIVMGEHPPISDPVRFRKELLQNINDEQSLYIFNYDPFIIEEEELRLKCNLAESEEEQEQILSQARYPKSNKGNFGILLSFNTALDTITILTPHLTQKVNLLHHENGGSGTGSEAPPEAYRTKYNATFANMVLEEHTISLQTLYRAVHQRDPYSKLFRGFVRVFINDKLAPSIPALFPLFVLDGSSTGGLLSVLDVNIAPHVLGLAMTHHLAVTFLLSDTARRKQSSRNLLSKANVCDVTLRGIPVTKIIQQLRLPLSVAVGESNRQSIMTLFVWYSTFLTQLQIAQDVKLGLVLPERRGGAEDGEANVSEESFVSHLQLCMDTQSIMLISFDLNAALNVKISEEETTHYAIVIGVDVERRTMRVADVNVKRFRKTWHLPIARMYNAVMGYGYMVAAKDKNVIKSLNGKQFQEQALSQAKYHLPPTTRVVKRFEYPNRPYPVTVLADAVERMGFVCDVERMINFSGFHVSFFLSRHLPLEGAGMVLQNFSHYALDDALSVSTHQYIYWSENPSAEEASDGSTPRNPLHRMLTEEDLVAEILHALERPESRKLLVKYDQEVVAADPSAWNGSDGGSYALVCEYDQRRRVVVLSNADVSTYYRTFSCPLSLLFVAICSWDAEAQSGRGTLLLDRDRSQESLFDNTRGYDLAHCLVHHPFKPIFSAVCACLALAATEMMRVVAPQLVDEPLSPSEAERLKYKRYNNIFSAEDILYSLPIFSVHDWKKVHSKDIFHIASIGFRALRLPLVAIDLYKEDESIFSDHAKFLDACECQRGVLTVVLVAYDTDAIHGVPGNTVGIVNRVERLNYVEGGGMIQLVHGNPCCFGAWLECSAADLMKAAITVVCVQEMEEADANSSEEDNVEEES